MINTFISKFTTVPLKKQVVKIRKIETQTVMEKKNPHLLKTATISITLFDCMLIILRCSREIIYII